MNRKETINLPSSFGPRSNKRIRWRQTDWLRGELVVCYVARRMKNITPSVNASIDTTLIPPNVYLSISFFCIYDLTNLTKYLSTPINSNDANGSPCLTPLDPGKMIVARAEMDIEFKHFRTNSLKILSSKCPTLANQMP